MAKASGGAETVLDWLGDCVGACEADGYREHEEAKWNGEDGPPEIVGGDGQVMIVQYMGVLFQVKATRLRKQE